MSEQLFLICPGAQKAGTTTLYQDLGGHPGICPASKKESRYFLDPDNSLSRADYLQRFFAKCENERYFFDVDPEFMYSPAAIGEIHRMLGNDVRFIFMLRNPVERSYSHYWMSYRRGFVSMTFEEALKHEEEALGSGDQFKRSHLSFMDRGFYASQIAGFLKLFPREHMKFIRFEDYMYHKEQVLADICDFLDLDPALLRFPGKAAYNEGVLPRFKFLSRLRGEKMLIKDLVKPLLPPAIRHKLTGILDKYNKNSEKPPAMRMETRQVLTNLYKDDIQRLQEITGIPFDAWLE